MRSLFYGLLAAVGFWLLLAAILFTRGVILLVLIALLITVLLFKTGWDAGKSRR